MNEIPEGLAGFGVARRFATGLPIPLPLSEAGPRRLRNVARVFVPHTTLPGVGERKQNFVGQHFWAGGYFVSTVGRDEALIRAAPRYIRNQEKEEQRLEQLKLGL